MNPVLPPTNLRPKHQKRETIVLVVILVLLLIGVAAGLFLTLQPQPLNIQERAQTLQTPICPTNGATCTWDAVSGSGISYTYTIVDQTTGTTVLTGTTQNTSVSFTPIVNHTYKCSVTAINSCGQGPTASALNTCVGPNTPMPTQVPTETPTPSITVTPTSTSTPTPTFTPTPTPTSPLISTPALTSPPGATATITPTPTEIVVGKVLPTSTPTPTLSVTPKPTTTPPVAGSNTGILFMVVSTVILVSLMLVF